MKYCYSCKKPLQPGEEVYVNAMVFCGSCAHQRQQSEAAQRSRLVQMNPPIDLSHHSNKWTSALHVIGIVALIIGVLASIGSGLSMMGASEDIGIVILIGGITASVVSVSLLMTFVEVSDRQEEMRCVLEWQLAMQKESNAMLAQQLESQWEINEKLAQQVVLQKVLIQRTTPSQNEPISVTPSPTDS